jgi:hypothetical protein
MNADAIERWANSEAASFGKPLVALRAERWLSVVRAIEYAASQSNDPEFIRRCETDVNQILFELGAA